MHYNKLINNKKKKAFTLIELLIVIAIIGILFIVLVSKVDFATDKAKATGVQTDFHSFQVAIETVAKENAGLATFGWDTGDVNGDRVRNSYDAGDTNQDGIRDAGEVWTGRKVYAETWTNIYTLTNPADANDVSAIFALETAINKNLDPKLHITIHDDYTITMANQARDPWGNEYYGYYISNAENDGKDRGAIVIFSSGANGEHGCEHDIAGGLTAVSIPGNNVYGKDDYSIATVYTYVNGYGEVKTTTTGFSNNQGNNNPDIVGSSSKIIFGQTYQFLPSFSNSDLEKLFNACTSGTQDQDDGYALLIYSDTHYIEIYQWDEGAYGIYYYNYDTDAEYDYVTQDLADAYDDVAGWHDCNNGYEVTAAPSLTFEEDDADYAYMPNGLDDLLPLFGKHTHSYTKCVCSCGDDNHTFVGNICSKCNLSDRGYYYDVLYVSEPSQYGEYFILVFNKDGTISMSDYVEITEDVIPTNDSCETVWNADEKTVQFYKYSWDSSLSEDYFVVESPNMIVFETYGDSTELRPYFNFELKKIPFETTIYNQYGDSFVLHSNNTVDVLMNDGRADVYNIVWLGNYSFELWNDNGSFNTHWVSYDGLSIISILPS